MQPTGERLSPREIEVVQLLATQAPSNKQIAAALGLSELTVKEYMVRIMKKLGLDNRTQVALWASSVRRQ